MSKTATPALAVNAATMPAVGALYLVVTTATTPTTKVLRVVAGGEPVYAAVVPGADIPTASLLTGAGAVAISARQGIPSAALSVGAGAVALSAQVPVPPASLATAAALIDWPGLAAAGHRLRVTANGAPVYAAMVPGADLLPAVLTLGAAPITWRAVMPGTGHTIRLRLRDLSPVVDLFSLSCRVRLADRSARLTLSARKEE
jgi:hypothetical protein